MSRIFEALRQSELDAQQEPGASAAPVLPEMLPVAALQPSRAETGLAEPGPAAMATGTTLDISQLTTVTPQCDDSAHLVALSDERGLGAEKFRVLATRLSNLRQTSGLKIVQITSTIVGEGKTLVACNLAVTLAKRSGQSVLLIEGDLRKPAVCSTFGVPAMEGIGELWRQKEKPAAEFLRRVGESSLCLLPAGEVPHPVTVLQSGRMADLVRQVAGWFDWIVVDTPPMLPMADSNLWTRLVDGTLLVVREGIVRRRALQSALESMDTPKLIGVVLNDAVDYDRMEYYGRYYAAEDGTERGSKRKGKNRK